MLTRLTKEKEMQNQDVHIARKKLQGKYEMHSHEFFEIEYILSGTGVYVVNGTAYPFKPGMLFFMTPADVHSVSVENGDFITVHVSENISGSLLLELVSVPKSAALLLTENDRRLAESLMTELLRAGQDAVYRERLAECLVSKIARLLKENTKEIAYGTLSQKAMLYMLKQFREPITLAEIAKELSVTPVYLSSVYKKETGENIKRYLDTLRFRYAKRLLSFSDLTVQQVAEESGFASYPNFIRRFKTTYGTSPGAYRKSTQFPK